MSNPYDLFRAEIQSFCDDLWKYDPGWARSLQPILDKYPVTGPSAEIHTEVDKLQISCDWWKREAVKRMIDLGEDLPDDAHIYYTLTAPDHANKTN